MSLYPLKFIPRFLEKMWGGRKIETVLGKKLPPGKLIGESWELYDFPPGVVDSSPEWCSSQIASGPLAGRSLHRVMQEFGNELLGDVPPLGPHGQFPLLIKFLDAHLDLSVQVHPDEAYAARHPGAHLKTEAWYVVQHDPRARIFKGLPPGTTPEAFRAAIESGHVEKHLATVNARPGQCHYLPSGTIHALGAGILVAEVQTPSDTTFRVYDFNRVEPSTGKHRTLHINQAMECIDFSAGHTSAPTSRISGHSRNGGRLVTSPFFLVDKVRHASGAEMPLDHNQPVMWIMLEGECQVKVDGIKDPVRMYAGDTVLLPAVMKHPMMRCNTETSYLAVTFPLKNE